MTHIHDLSCLKRPEGMPDHVVEPFELACGFPCDHELTEEYVRKVLGMNTVVKGWVHDNVEFSSDGRSFRLKPDQPVSTRLDPDR